MRITVTDRCVGHGVCESLAADLFEVGDDGASHLLLDPIPAERADAAHAAVRGCPAQALLADDDAHAQRP